MRTLVHPLAHRSHSVSKILLARNVGTFTSIYFITANSSAHNLCSEILIFFYLDVKPLDYALHIVPVTWFLFCISIVVLTENVIRDLCCDVLQGPNHTHSGDGHDKLMGFMNCTFPLTGYGPWYVLYLKLWTSNSDPKLIGRWYLKHLYGSKGEICTPVNVNLSLLFPDPFFPSWKKNNKTDLEITKKI